MRASPLYIQDGERQVLTHLQFITLTEKIRRRAHHSFGQVRRNLQRSSHTRESRAESFIPTHRESSENVNKFKSSWNCEGDGDVVGVLTSLRGGAQVVLHGVQVLELSVLLGVHQEGEVEEDGEGQVEVEREEGEVRERRSWMACG